ncbi:MAG: ribonuclease III family protein [Promethearchaeota archaeon]
MSTFEELQALLETENILSIETAMRHKELAKLGDPLSNLLFSLALSSLIKRFEGEKVSGKILAAALRLAELRHLAPARLDAHGLGDCVEAMIAYGWLREFFTIQQAATILQEQFLKSGVGTKQSKTERRESIAMGFAVFLQYIWEQNQTLNLV